MTQPFDELAEVYEAMVDWPKRLAYEGPFYRGLFDRVAARRVVDTACGGGDHAAMFHSWELDVEGADISPRMIDQARRQFGEPPGLRWTVRGFDQPMDASEPFDVAICVGNSLALAGDRDVVRRAIGAMLAAVRPGGAVVLGVANLWRLDDGPCHWQKCVRRRLSRGETLILKGMHRAGDRGFVDLVLLDPEGGLIRSDSTPLLGLRRETLEEMVTAAGGARIEVFGGYRGEPYDENTSVDLLVVARE